MRTPGWYWPWLLVAGMAGIVGVNVWMLTVARSDANGVVVEPDYYRKAVQWDSAMARSAASARLGWRFEVTLERAPAGADAATVAVALVDSAGAPVRGATVRATLIHNADAARRVELALLETASGGYASDARLAHAGMWEVRVFVERQGARFEGSRRAELAAAPLPAGHGP